MTRIERGRAPTAMSIYLNDHLAGAMAGLELIKRMAAAERDRTEGRRLAELVTEVAQDRASLLELMSDLGIAARGYKSVLGWVGEKVGRLKLNGRVFRRAELSRVIELEAMRLGVEAKAAVWRTLREKAETDARLDAERLDGLLDRATRQADLLEALRVRAAAEVFQGEVPFQRRSAAATIE